MSWPLVTLGEVATFINGDRGKNYPSKGSFVESGVAFINAGSLSLEHKLIDSELNYITQDKYDSLRSGKVEKGDILFCLRGSLGKFAVVENDIKGAIASSLVIIRANHKIALSYLKHYLGSVLCAREIDTFENGAAQPNLSATDLKSFKIPLPPLDEQKRIAAILDKADAIRQKRKQAIALADEFLRSVFLDMFGDPVTNPKGWEEPILSDIADVRSGVTKGKKLKEGTGITLPYMRVANVQDGYLDLSSIQTITVSEKDAEKCKLLRGDILLTEGGDPDKLGRGDVWNGEIDNCIHQNHIFSVRVKDEDYVRPAFLSAVIGSQRGKRYFLKVGKQTTGIATINKTVLSEFCPIVPPLELQDSYLKIASRIKRMQTRKHYHEVTLFPSLSQKAFSGQL
ncbi:TPA: restriction endonuclease subunit S [Vibrio cholerae]